uniref:Uncharacterized protein n=1 Tax=Leptocylindrus danicus TaxID=163516 RepID=A0A7S2L403_9STRA|eukprot:CAMPEP_0116028184 /NCGR_PEP_ID=MMETSP0321-20121206/15226_1 /TAXON_ID=163516 /ORGANISM="Leptocylindrus danicus var. danicus, Strain B650" /LENGTH=159 /DNA_ID=CAMNT_0003501987 /DNA_START=52 /DNA_END=531 /DNA_ORIENTATION=+
MPAPDDFTDFAESVIKQKAEQAAWQSSADQHQLWKETTYAGKFTVWLKEIGKSGFIRAVTRSIKDAQHQTGEKGWSFIILANLSRLMFVLIFMLVIKVIGRIVQNMVGKEITQVDEVVIVHTVKSSKNNNLADDDDDDADTSNVPTETSSRRGKKSKAA